MTDASHLTLLPHLLAHVRAGGARRPHRRDQHHDRDGTTHSNPATPISRLAFCRGSTPGFYQQTLFLQDFVCLASASHPRIGNALTLRRFKEEAHVALTLSGTGHDVVDGAIEKSAHSASSIARPARLSRTGRDRVDHRPDRDGAPGIGEILARSNDLTLLECPVKIPAYAVKQHWHARYHHDLGNRWLRGACAGLFSVPERRTSHVRASVTRSK